MIRGFREMADSITSKTSPALEEAMGHLKKADDAATEAAAAFLQWPSDETRAELATQATRAAWWRMTARKLNVAVRKAA